MPRAAKDLFRRQLAMKNKTTVKKTDRKKKKQGTNNCVSTVKPLECGSHPYDNNTHSINVSYSSSEQEIVSTLLRHLITCKLWSINGNLLPRSSRTTGENIWFNLF